MYRELLEMGSKLDWTMAKKVGIEADALTSVHSVRQLSPPLYPISGRARIVFVDDVAWLYNALTSVDDQVKRQTFHPRYDHHGWTQPSLRGRNFSRKSWRSSRLIRSGAPNPFYCGIRAIADITIY